MSRFTLCIALIAAGLLAVGCGSSTDKPSSGNSAKPVVTPAGTAAQAATPKASSDAKTAEKSSASGAVTATASPQAKKAIKRQLAQVKAAKARAKSTIKALNTLPRRINKAAVPAAKSSAAAIKALQKKVSSGQKLTKADMKKAADLQAQAIKQQTAAAKQALDGVKLQQPKQTGKVGRSKIPGRVSSVCKRNLRPVDGALNSAAKAKALPAALSRTIKSLAVLGSTNSPALTGVTGDLPGLGRTQETLGAMRKVVKPAKAYASSQSAGNRATLARALKTLKNTAYSDVLNSCAIA
jgi:hypothetical protein